MGSIAAIVSIVVGTIIIIVGVVLGWSVFPNLVESQIGEVCSIYKIIDIHIYILNKFTLKYFFIKTNKSFNVLRQLFDY